MINYSLYTDECIFADWDDFNPEYEEITTSDGLTLLVERIDAQQVKVFRVISSDPAVYLRDDIMPGTIIKTSLQI